MAKRTLANWWKMIFTILLMVMVVTLVSYSFGANSVRAKTGAKINIDRSQDAQLFKVNGKYALRFFPEFDLAGADLVEYHETPSYLRILGKYEHGKTVLNGVARDGDWFYYPHPGFRDKGQLIAINAKTDEKVLKNEAANDDLSFFPQNLLDKGLKLDDKKMLNAADLAKMESLSTPKESAIVMVSAFAFLIFVWLLILPFALKKEKY